jgi:hypothetical protein
MDCASSLSGSARRIQPPVTACVAGSGFHGGRPMATRISKRARSGISCGGGGGAVRSFGPGASGIGRCANSGRTVEAERRDRERGELPTLEHARRHDGRGPTDALGLHDQLDGALLRRAEVVHGERARPARGVADVRGHRAQHERGEIAAVGAADDPPARSMAAA